jgi:hypothetical protein
MSKPTEERDVYYIPPNFLTTGRLFGGMLRIRNAIEAGILVLGTGIPIFKLPLSLTARIIILCLITLPLGIFAIVGLDGDSLSEFVINWFKWLFNRRILYRSDVEVQHNEEVPASPVADLNQPPEELGIRVQKRRTKKKAKIKREPKELIWPATPKTQKARPFENCTEDLVPVMDIKNGIIHMSDGRFIKILELNRSISSSAVPVSKRASYRLLPAG